MGEGRRHMKYVATIDGQKVTVRRIICASCGDPGEIADRTRGGLPSVIVERNFKSKGWEVGASEKHDFCPACIKKRQTERRSRRVKPVATIKEEETPMKSLHAIGPALMNGASSLNGIAPAISETPPGEASRIQKRIINTKLEEVYGDETTGYKTPWTDAAVAKDLSVPVAWVVAIREEFFGPAADNSEIRDMLSRVTDASLAATKVLDQAKAIRIEAAGMVERVNSLSKEATEIGKTLNGLLTIAERIERSLKA